MKDLLSEEHYCYKLHTFLMKNNSPQPPSLPPPHTHTHTLPDNPHARITYFLIHFSWSSVAKLIKWAPVTSRNLMFLRNLSHWSYFFLENTLRFLYKKLNSINVLSLSSRVPLTTPLYIAIWINQITTYSRLRQKHRLLIQF